ncbi:aquaporin [Streptomyces sp. NPDC057474]|uniref:aquaporin n=1 Tax=Streptomyces sp. NPDC057474 TaxID=3346144 RepID=UPI00367EA4D0
MNAAASDTRAVSSGPVVARHYPLFEFALSTVLLFTVVTVVRWLMAPPSPLRIADVQTALAVVGVIVGAVLLCLIYSPWGRRSGAHMNPAVSVALWLMGAFPRRWVLPYVLAQLAGSLAGAALAGLVWGQTATAAPIRYAAVQPAPDWNGLSVFVAEFGCLVAVTLLIGFFLAYPARARWLPLTLAAATALIVGVLGPRSGGATNPARQLGPALLSGESGYLAIYLIAPVLGAVLGAGIHQLLQRYGTARRVPTYHLCPSTADPALT